MAKETGDGESICGKVINISVAKAEANLNWLWTDYELIMDCFDCMFTSTNDLA